MTTTSPSLPVPASPAQPAASPMQNLLARHEQAITDALSATPLRLGEFMIALRSAAIAEPLINDCLRDDPSSVLACVMEAAQRGLRPGRVFGHFALIPRKMNGRWTLTSLVEYRGLMHLAERCNLIEEMHAEVVYKGERFRYDHRTREIEHNPYDLEDGIERVPENLVGAYAVVRIKGRARPCVAVLRRIDVERIREKSDSWRAYQRDRSKKTPWVTDTTEMWKKVALRKVLNSGEVPIAGSVVDEPGLEETTAAVAAPAVQTMALPANPAPLLSVHVDADAAVDAGAAEPPVEVSPGCDFVVAVGPPAMTEGRAWFDAFSGDLRVCHDQNWQPATEDEEAGIRACLVEELGDELPPNHEQRMLGELADLVAAARRANRANGGAA